MTDRAANNNPCTAIDYGDHGVTDHATDVVEIDIDPSRHALDFGAERSRVCMRFVINRPVQSERVAQPCAFCRAAGNAKYFTAVAFGKLRDQRTDRARRAGYDNHFTGMRYGDLKKQVAEMVAVILEPVQKRYREIVSDPGYLTGVLRESAARVRPMALETVEMVKQRMGLYTIS